MINSLFADGAALFSVPLLIGAGYFLLRLLFSTLFGDHSDHGDPGHAGSHSQSTTEQAFNYLSIQAMCAFALGFGAAGLGAFRGGTLNYFLSIAIAFAGGFIIALLLAFLTRSLAKLEASGNISIQEAINQIGEAYIAIPAAGQSASGKVKLILKERQVYYNAVSAGEAIPTNRRVRVVGVNADNTVTVSLADVTKQP